MGIGTIVPKKPHGILDDVQARFLGLYQKVNMALLKTYPQEALGHIKPVQKKQIHPARAKAGQKPSQKPLAGGKLLAKLGDGLQSSHQAHRAYLCKAAGHKSAEADELAQAQQTSQSQHPQMEQGMKDR
ncbi:hypothetical protein DRQ12_11925 [candidate division KSB1 bacterium]|nr:MAG: hypothetical protein DRQ12_11925 [candidate division KSB1 bacterium]